MQLEDKLKMTALSCFQVVVVLLFVFHIIVHGMCLGIITFEYITYRDWSELSAIQDAYLALLIVTCFIILITLVGIIPVIFWPTVMVCWGILYLILSLLRFCCGLAAHLMVTFAIAKFDDYYLPPHLIENEETEEKKPIYEAIMGLVFSGLIGDCFLFIMMLTTTVACLFCGHQARKEQKERLAAAQLYRKVEIVPPREPLNQPQTIEQKKPSSPPPSPGRVPPSPGRGASSPGRGTSSPGRGASSPVRGSQSPGGQKTIQKR